MKRDRNCVRIRRRTLGGFTLVEMIVATLLLAIGMVACLSAIGSSVRSTGVGREYSTAAILADRQFSELLSDPNAMVSGEQSGEFGQDYPGFTWAQSIEQTDIQYLMRITLKIEWFNGSASRSALFTTYAPQPQTEQTAQ